MTYGWFEDDKLMFDCTQMYYAYDNDGSRNRLVNPGTVMTADSRERKYFQSHTKRDDAVGIVFVEPGDEIHNMSTLCMMLGTCGFVPEGVRHVAITNTATAGNLDLRRKMLAYNPGNLVLADLREHPGESLYTRKDFEVARIVDDGMPSRQWEVHRVSPDVEAALRAGFGALSELTAANVFMSYACGNPPLGVVEIVEDCRSLSNDSSELHESTKTLSLLAKSASWERSMHHAMASASALSFGKLDLSLYEEWDAPSIVERLSSVARLADRGQVKEKRWQEWKSVEKYDLCKWDITEFSSENSSPVELAHKMEDIRSIWQWALTTQCSILELPLDFSEPFGDEEKEALAFEAIRQLGHLYGIDSHVDAYLSGVPLEDIFA